MGSFTVGDIVLIPFPYADFSKFKKRPALVVGQAEFNNLILCQITSNAETSKCAIPLVSREFEVGSLQVDSYVRPDKLFTVEQLVIETKLGSLKLAKTMSIKSIIIKLFA